jgi:hypothetical protein
MDRLALCLAAQTSLAFGMAGVLWPDKFSSFFETLMFPWTASYRFVRLNGVAAIGLSIVLLLRLFGIRS